MVTSEIVDYDFENKLYSLPSEKAELLTRNGSFNFAASLQFIPSLGQVEDEIIPCFENGGGVPYESYTRFHDIMAEESNSGGRQDSSRSEEAQLPSRHIQSSKTNVPKRSKLPMMPLATLLPSLGDLRSLPKLADALKDRSVSLQKEKDISTGVLNRYPM